MIDRLTGVFSQTTAEYTTLLAWFALTMDQPILAIAVLAFGMVAEHLIAWQWFAPMPLGDPVGRIVGISISETVIWAVWLVVFGMFGIIPAMIFLAVSMIVQHSIENNLFRTGKLGGNFFNLSLIDFTLLEVIGASAWIVLWNDGQQILGAIILFVGLFTEHFIQSGKQ